MGAVGGGYADRGTVGWRREVIGNAGILTGARE